MSEKAKDLVLVINPGSTTTKISVFSGETQIIKTELSHSIQELAQFDRIIDQADFRYQIITQFLKTHQLTPRNFIAVVGRGGLMRPITSGTYQVDAAMLKDIRSGKYGEHATNLGTILADKFAQAIHIPAYTVDAPVTDELEPVAYISGNRHFSRRSAIHALNQRAAAKYVCRRLHWDYHTKNLIVAHLGGGVTVGAHQHGRIIDSVNGLDGEGPFGPNRAGALPGLPLIDYIYQNHPSIEVAKQLFVGQGAGLISYFQTQDLDEVVAKALAGNELAAVVVDALAYQVAKSIGAYATVLEGKVDGIILTGGMSKNQHLVPKIKQRVAWIAPIFMQPGQMEMEALNLGVQEVLTRKVQVKDYLTEVRKIAKKQQFLKQ